MSITLSASQDTLVNEFPAFLLSDDKELTISGFAGSGKTFLVRYLTDMAPAQQKMVQLLDPKIQPRKFFYTATTNKAAEVLRGTLNRETSTIHSLLGLRVINDYKTGKQSLKPGRDGCKNLSHSIIFIDEASMINADLLDKIRKSTSRFADCKIVFIGDTYQLPPVKENVCPVFAHPKGEVYFLNEIQRQAADHPIIQLSAKYRAMLDDETLSWPEIPSDGKFIQTYADKTEYFDVLRTAFRNTHKPNDLKIVAWSNKRVRQYNTWIRNLLGYGTALEPGEAVTTTKPLFQGRQIVAPTDYCLTVREVKPGIEQDINGHWLSFTELPGSFFQPVNWNQANALLKAYAKDKDWGPYFALKEDWIDVRAIHASTVHKSQGSTYREVFVDLEDIGRCTHWRDVVRLLYVGITRASHRVHIYGNITTNHTKTPTMDLMGEFRNVHQLI